MFDGEAFGKQMVEIVRGHVERTTAPLFARIAELETRELLLPEKGNDGVGVVSAEVRHNVLEITLSDGTVIEAGDVGPIHGKDADPEMVKAIVSEAVAALPQPDKGDPGEVDMAEVAGLVETAVKSAVEALPVPKDGEPGKDGPGFADALIDDEGALVLTRTDGTTKTLPRVKGQDGQNAIGIAEWAEEDGNIVVRHTDGSEVVLPLPDVPNICPDDTSELVAKAIRAVAEAPDLAIPAPPAEKQAPVLVNVNTGAPPPPARTHKSITTRRDAGGNLIADIIEAPDI